MTTNILKAIGVGFLLGVLVFFMPFFLFRGLFIVLIIALIFRLAGIRRRWHWGNGSTGFWNNPAYMQRWYSMTDDERTAFREKMEKELFTGTA